MFHMFGENGWTRAIRNDLWPHFLQELYSRIMEVIQILPKLSKKTKEERHHSFIRLKQLNFSDKCTYISFQNKTRFLNSVNYKSHQIQHSARNQKLFGGKTDRFKAGRISRACLFP